MHRDAAVRYACCKPERSVEVGKMPSFKKGARGRAKPSTIGDDLSVKAKLYRDAGIDHRALFRDYVASPEFYAAASVDPDIFHDALIEASTNGWLHYSRLGVAMGLDPSTVSRWFQQGEKRKTPEFYRRRAAIDALNRIVSHDLKLLTQDKKPIGHLSVKDCPELGFPPISSDTPSDGKAEMGRRATN